MYETEQGPETNQDQQTEGHLAEAVLAHVDPESTDQTGLDGSEAQAAAFEGASSDENIVDGHWVEQDTRPDEQTAETIAHAANKLETYLKSAEGRESKDQIAFVKANLQRQLDFIEANPDRAQTMYLQTKAQLFDRLQETVRDQMSWYGRDGHTMAAVPNFELNNMLEAFDQIGVDVAFGAAISRAADAERSDSEAAPAPA